MSWTVELELIGGDEQPRTLFGSFRTQEAAARFCELVREHLPKSGDGGQFVSAYPVPIYQAQVPAVRALEWLDPL